MNNSQPLFLERLILQQEKLKKFHPIEDLFVIEFVLEKKKKEMHQKLVFSTLISCFMLKTSFVCLGVRVYCSAYGSGTNPLDLAALGKNVSTIKAGKWSGLQIIFKVNH